LVKILEGFTSRRRGHVVDSDDVSRLSASQAEVSVAAGILGLLKVAACSGIRCGGREDGVDSGPQEGRSGGADSGVIPAAGGEQEGRREEGDPGGVRKTPGFAQRKPGLGAALAGSVLAHLRCIVRSRWAGSRRKSVCLRRIRRHRHRPVRRVSHGG